MGEAKEEKN